MTDGPGAPGAIRGGDVLAAFLRPVVMVAGLGLVLSPVIGLSLLLMRLAGSGVAADGQSATVDIGLFEPVMGAIDLVFVLLMVLLIVGMVRRVGPR